MDRIRPGAGASPRGSGGGLRRAFVLRIRDQRAEGETGRLLFGRRLRWTQPETKMAELLQTPLPEWAGLAGVTHGTPMLGPKRLQPALLL